MMTAALPRMDTPAIAELSERRQWVCWVLQNRKGKPTKVPVQPNGLGAATDNPATWSTLAQCLDAVAKHGYAGVGYVFDGDVVGVDLDKCRDPLTGAIDDWAMEIIARLRSYTEVSPSGTGVHIIVRGQIPRDGGRRGQIEVYTRLRFFCVTGNWLDQWPDEIVDAEEGLEWLWATHIRRAAPAAEVTEVEAGELPFDKFDALMVNDTKFRQTFLHKRADLQDQSLSAYDFSLCVQAAQAGWNDGELAALIHAHRKKWGGEDKASGRKDYVSRTVANTREVLRRRLEGNESLGNAMAAVMAREHAEETLEGGQDEALRELRERLGLPISRVVIVGEKTAISYWLVLDDGRRIGLGDAGRVLDQQTMRRAAFASVGKVIPTVKQPMWDATVIVLQAAAEREEAADSDPIAALRAMIEDYTYRVEVTDWDHDQANQAFVEGEPMRRDGRLMISIRHFSRWCFGQGVLGDVKPAELHNRLRQAGWAGRHLGRRIDGKVKNLFYWLEPVSALAAESAED